MISLGNWKVVTLIFSCHNELTCCQGKLPAALSSWPGLQIPQVTLDAAGLVLLADLTTIASRTALTGTSTLLDAFVLCPGLHRQQSAAELSGGEYPACAAMTTGYVFRVENPATVFYLQKVGVTGQLTTLMVENIRETLTGSSWFFALFYTFQSATTISAIAYLSAVLLAMVALIFFLLSANWWGVVVLLSLAFVRLCNVLIIRRRDNQDSWKGMSEPGVNGDLLILLSQDRWIRMRGAVDDLKAVTSGQWLRDMTFLESSVSAFATILTFLTAALTSNVDQTGKIVLLGLVVASVGLLAVANEYTEILQMHGNVVKVKGQRKAYKRRLEMAEQLIEESGRDDWALRMGMIVSSSKNEKPEKASPPKVQEGVVM